MIINVKFHIFINIFNYRCGVYTYLLRSLQIYDYLYYNLCKKERRVDVFKVYKYNFNIRGIVII